MNAAHRAPVAPRDERARALSQALPDERTPRDDEPPTIPDPSSGGERIHLASAPVDKAGILRVPAFVDLGIGPDAITRPDGRETSDVFLPMKARGRAVDLEAPTPRDRPARVRDEDAPTDRDDARKEGDRTVTYRGRLAALHERDGLVVPIRKDWENERERRFVESVYDTQRSFLLLKERNPPRAAHVEGLHRALKTSGVFGERDLILAMHAREKAALVELSGDIRARREDRVYALGLLAREIDDRYRDHTRVLKVQLLEDVRDLPPAKRDEVFEDFETFKSTGAAADSNYCRRELHRALRDEQVLHRAYVFALALDRRSDPERVEANAETLLADLSGPRRARAGGCRHRGQGRRGEGAGPL